MTTEHKPHSSANDGRTHWAECWRVHLDCAEVRIERLEEQIETLREESDAKTVEWHRLVEDYRRSQEQLEAAQKNLDKQMASMSAALTREVRAREGLQEQYQAARELLVETHDLIWNEDAAMVAGGEKLLDALAEKIMAYLDSNPASEQEAS